MESKVNVFLVGAAKCGTTSLAAKLGAHPEVSLGYVKEPFYFVDKHGIDNLKDYMSLYDFTKRLRVDASTGYLFPEVTAKKIYEYNPDAKILIVLRNPLKQMVSYWEYMKANGKEVSDFDIAISDNEIAYRKSNQFVESCEQWAPSYWYLDRAKYALQVSRYLEQFDKSRVKVILFEDLINGTDTLEEVYKFLGVSFDGVGMQRDNATGRPNPLIRWLRFSSTLEPMKVFYRNFLHLKWRNSVRLFLVSKAMSDVGYVKYEMPNNLRDELVLKLCDDVAQLKKLLPELDFSKWKEF